MFGSRARCPWFGPCFHASRRKLRAFRKFAFSRSHSSWFEFLLARREAASVFLKERTAYERKLSIFAGRSPKVFWRYVNSRCQSTSRFFLKSGSEHISDPKKVANLFANFFSNIYSCETSNPPQLASAHVWLV